MQHEKQSQKQKEKIEIAMDTTTNSEITKDKQAHSSTNVNKERGALKDSNFLDYEDAEMKDNEISIKKLLMDVRGDIRFVGKRLASVETEVATIKEEQKDTRDEIENVRNEQKVTRQEVREESVRTKTYIEEATKLKKQIAKDQLDTSTERFRCKIVQQNNNPGNRGRTRGTRKRNVG